MLKENMFTLTKEPGKTYGPPAAKDAVPFLNFSSLENALVQLKNSTDEFQKLYSKGISLSADKKAQLNTILYQAEQSLLQQAGLPRRPWYRHEIYAPGFYTGYGVKTLPGIREGIEQRNWKEAQAHIEIVAKTLETYTAQVNQAIGLLR